MKISYILCRQDRSDCLKLWSITFISWSLCGVSERIYKVQRYERGQVVVVVVIVFSCVSHLQSVSLTRIDIKQAKKDSSERDNLSIYKKGHIPFPVGLEVTAFDCCQPNTLVHSVIVIVRL